MSDLIQKSTEALMEGTSLSLGMINKYLKFISMQKTAIGSLISPEKTRQFIEKMFNPPVESDIPNAHQIFSFMEQDLYEDEAIDGMWVPIKVAPHIHAYAIEEGIDFLENYEPFVEEDLRVEESIHYNEQIIEAMDIDEVFGEALWKMTKEAIDTDSIENYLKAKQEVELEELIIESSSNDFGDAVRSLMATSALVANKKIEVDPAEVEKEYQKEWEWIEDGDKKYKIRHRERKKRGKGK